MKKKFALGNPPLFFLGFTASLAAFAPLVGIGSLEGTTYVAPLWTQMMASVGMALGLGLLGLWVWQAANKKRS